MQSVHFLAFQFWAEVDKSGQKILKTFYKLFGISHNVLLSNKHRFWSFEKIKKYIDFLAHKKLTNCVILADCHIDKFGGLFNEKGINPKNKNFLQKTYVYTKQKGLFFGLQPRNYPQNKSSESLKKWFSNIKKSIPDLDILKISLEWLDGYIHKGNVPRDVLNIIKATKKVYPKIFIILNSISREWKKPRKFHYWISQKYQNIPLGFYTLEKIYNERKNKNPYLFLKEFKKEGFKNIFLHILPNEGSQIINFEKRFFSDIKYALSSNISLLIIAGANFSFDKKLYKKIKRKLGNKLKLVSDKEQLISKIRNNNLRKNFSFKKVIEEEENTKPVFLARFYNWLHRA